MLKGFPPERTSQGEHRGACKSQQTTSRTSLRLRQLFANASECHMFCLTFDTVLRTNIIVSAGKSYLFDGR